MRSEREGARALNAPRSPVHDHLPGGGDCQFVRLPAARPACVISRLPIFFAGLKIRNRTFGRMDRMESKTGPVCELVMECHREPLALFQGRGDLPAGAEIASLRNDSTMSSRAPGLYPGAWRSPCKCADCFASLAMTVRCHHEPMALSRGVAISPRALRLLRFARCARYARNHSQRRVK
jgi:hypothetical protein